MGLFSSKYVTTVGTSVSRVIEDDMLPSAPKTGLIKALFEEGNITDYVLDEMINSIGVRSERMYEYASKHYPYGLPSGQTLVASQGKAQVEAVLRQITGQPILLEYSRYGAANFLHMGWMALVNQYGYDSTTNMLTVAGIEADTYLKDMVVCVPEAMMGQIDGDSLDQWGISPAAGFTPQRTLGGGLLAGHAGHTPVHVSDAYVDVHVKVTYVWQTEEHVPVGDESYLRLITHEDSFGIPITVPDPNLDYFHAKYAISDKAYYWMYQVGTGTHPSLDALVDFPPDVTGTYFPFVYFRYGKQPMDRNTQSAEYQSSKRLLRRLGMDYQQVIDAIHENEDIGDIEQAMLMYGVPAKTQDPMELRYLFAYFTRLYQNQETPFTLAPLSRATSLLNSLSLDFREATVIQDTMFKMALKYRAIYMRRKMGVIGAKGTYTGAFRMEREMMTTVFPEGGDPMYWWYDYPVYTYRHQISDTLFDEIELVDLRMMYHVNEDYAVTADEDDDILLVPIDRAITDAYSIPDREHLYARSLHFVFNSLVVTKLRWYQQEWFEIFMNGLSVILTVASFGSLGKAWAALTAAVAAGTMTIQAAIITIRSAILKYLWTLLAVKLFVKVAGPELGMLVAVIAAVAATYNHFNPKGLEGLPFADELVNVSTSLMKGVENFYSSAIAGLQADYQSFLEMAQQQWDALEEANALLDSGNNHLSPFTLFGESPDQYYQRTVHSGNMSSIALESVSMYVDRALTLPTLSQTLGGTFYA